jgi:transposase
MRLCAVIGSGRVGRYVVERITKVQNISIIGLRPTRAWLSSICRAEAYVGPMILNHLVTLSYKIRRNLSLWSPHTLLEAIRYKLKENNITLRSLLEYPRSLRKKVS